MKKSTDTLDMQYVVTLLHSIIIAQFLILISLYTPIHFHFTPAFIHFITYLHPPPTSHIISSSRMTSLYLKYFLEVSSKFPHTCNNDWSNYSYRIIEICAKIMKKSRNHVFRHRLISLKHYKHLKNVSPTLVHKTEICLEIYSNLKVKCDIIVIYIYI